jgi:hypothetical protein
MNEMCEQDSELFNFKVCGTYITSEGASGSVSWLWHYVTSRNVAGLIHDEVIEFFNDLIDSAALWL